MNQSFLLCSTPLWSPTVMWHTHAPDFTSCFYFLVAPAFLLLSALLLLPTLLIYFRKSCHRRPDLEQVTAVAMARVLCPIAFCLFLVFDVLTSLLTSEHGIEYRIQPALLLCSVAAVGVVQFVELRRQRPTSGLPFLFWLLVVCYFGLVLQSELRSLNLWHSWQPKFWLLVVYCCLSLVSLVSATVSSHKPGEAVGGRLCPEETANYISRLSFWWMTSLIVSGFKKPLTGDSLFELNKADSCATIFPRFRAAWNARASPHLAASQKFTNPLISEDCEMTRMGRRASARQTEVLLSEERKSDGFNPILLMVLVKMFLPTIALSVLLKFFFDMLNFSGTLILKAILTYLEDKSSYTWRGFMYVGLMLVSSVVQTSVLHQYFHTVFVLGMRIRTVLMCAVYKKALKLSKQARATTTTGSIVNMMSVDAFKFQDLMSYLNILWSGPLQITICMVLLYRELGTSIFVGVAILVFMIPTNAFVANLTKKLQMKQMEVKDSRMKLISEILAGIKVIKLYAWELAFSRQVTAVRLKELEVMRKMALLNAFGSFTWVCTPVLVSIATFTVYSLSSDANVLDAEKCFVSISLFNLLRFPLMVLPMVATSLVECSVSLRRLTNFLTLEEIPKDAVDRMQQLDAAVRIENGKFSWDGNDSDPTLTDVDFTVPQGKLVAVVGTVGSGKSSLLSAILGEIPRLAGRVKVKGSVAYVSQEPFIQNLTLQDNILFNCPMDRQRYESVVRACALQRDLEILRGGDQTEIGEKGITLSGGQKARVALARACYAEKDLYLLDDPLSAVDVHVGKHLFEQVLSSKTGFLKGKTRLLVTHSLTYLPLVDHIVVLSNGRISEAGTFAELVKAEGPFSRLVDQFLQSHKHNELHNSSMAKDDVRAVLNLLDEIQKEEEAADDQEEKKATQADDGMPQKALGAQQVYRTTEDEKAETGKVKWRVYFIYLKSTGVQFCVLILVYYIFNHSLALGSNFWLADWTKDAKLSRNTTEGWSTRQRIGVLALFGLLQSVITFAGSFMTCVAFLRASRKLHESLLMRVLGCALTFFEWTPLGRVVNRFGSDIESVDKNLAERWRSMLRISFWIIEAIIAIAVALPPFLAGLVFIGALFFLVQHVFIGTSRQLKRLESTAKSPIFSHFAETLNGVSSIRAFEQQKVFKQICDNRIDRFNMRYYPSISSNRWLAVRLEFVGSLIITFTCLLSVLVRDSVSAGLVGLAAIYALSVTQSLNWLVRMVSELETNIVSVERIKEYTELQQEAPWQREDEPELPEGWPLGAISFKSISCRYRSDLPLAIEDVNLDVKPGQRVGIVGRTGSGKSTLTLSLFRVLEPCAGTLSVDGIDVGQLGLHTLRQRLTLIPQDPLLFAGSLRWNLDPFECYSDEDIWSALETAHLKAWTQSLDRGLLHEIAEGGSNLSLGQRQLLCLARALLRRSRLLVLDEATAAVDVQTDALIQATIREKFSDSTLITVAHRINTVMDYDIICVLHQGKIVEKGSPQQLLADTKSFFHSMAKQAGIV